MNNKDKIINRLKVKIDEHMQSQGLKRYSLAEKAGISQPTIHNWYSKRSYDPTLDSVIKISEVLQISLSELFLDENSIMYPVNEELMEMITMFQSLTIHNKKLLIELMKNLRKD